MEYTDPILRRMRERLERYRMENKVNGRTRPWHVVAEDVFPPKLDEDDDDEVSFKAEAEMLRRFAAGTQTPTPARLDQLRDFLMDEGYLSGDDIAAHEAIPAEVRGLYNFTGYGDDQLEETFRRFGTAFAAVHGAPRQRHEISFLRLDKEPGCIKVQEVVHWSSAAPQAFDPKALERFVKRHSMATVRRDGWLVELSSGQLLLFLRDPKIGEVECCTVIADGREETMYNHEGAMHLLKHRAFSDPQGYVPHVDALATDTHGIPTTMIDAGIANWMASQLWRYEKEQPWHE